MSSVTLTRPQETAESDVDHPSSAEKESSEPEGDPVSVRTRTEERMNLLQGGEKKKKRYSTRTKILCVVFVVVVVLLVLAAVIVVAVLVPLSLRAQPSEMTTITIDDIFNSSFKQKFYSGSWTKDGKLLHISSDDGVTLYDPETLVTTTLLDGEHVVQYNISNAAMSADGSLLLLVSNVQKVFRHSFLADYYVMDVLSGMVNGSSQSMSPVPVPEGAVAIQYVSWSPTDDVLALVAGNNVYAYHVSNGSTDQLTFTGVTNTIYNGIPDWVYEEEMLGTNFALWWSPDGTQILYASFNDTLVGSFSFPKYGSLEEQLQYTEIESILYPKAGTTNPTVVISVVDVTNASTIVLNPESSVAQSDYYLMFGGWVGNTTASVAWINRAQNSSVFCLYDISSSDECSPVHRQNMQDGWIEIVQPPVVSNEEKMFIIDSNDDGYLHISQVNTDGGTAEFLTSGEWEVTSIIGTNDDGTDVLYVSTNTNPWQRHIYSVRSETCLTCDREEEWEFPISMNSSLGNKCDYWSASCSNNLLYCLLQCSGPTLPFSLLVKYSDGLFHPVSYMEKNAELESVLESVSLPTVDVIEVPESEDGPLLYARVLYPPDFSTSKTYPVLFYVYGGPYSQMIGNVTVTSNLFMNYLVSNLNMIVVSVDGRGTGFRGNRFKFSVYRQLGLLETTDQLRTGRQFQQLDYVDESKLAIYGASYGGYMAGMVGSSGSSVFSAAISQSPVTDWLYYDTIYTERYMGLPTPDDNSEGYQGSSLLHKSGKLADVDYLLIHGTGDDNVHFQNTAQMVQALTEEDVQFRLQIYTDKAHSLSGESTRRHLYELITEFLQVSFGL